MGAPAVRRALVAVGLLALAACSSGGSTAAGPTTSPAASPASPTSAASAAGPGGASLEPSAEAPAVDRTVAADAQATAPAVPLDRSVEVGGTVVRVTAARVVDVAAQGVGDVDGPGVAITLAVRNGSAQPLSLDTLGVTVTSGAEAVPAAPSDADPASPLVGTVEPGDERSGTWVFRTGQGDPADLHVVVSLAADQPAVLLEGSAA